MLGGWLNNPDVLGAAAFSTINASGAASLGAAANSASSISSGNRRRVPESSIQSGHVWAHLVGERGMQSRSLI